MFLVHFNQKHNSLNIYIVVFKNNFINQNTNDFSDIIE